MWDITLYQKWVTVTVLLDYVYNGKFVYTHYSIQFAAGQPLFNDRFHLDPSKSNIVLATSGPIAGFLVQPIAGVFSDNSTSKFGRRRPFILVGTLMTALGMALIACSEKLGNALGDNPTGTTSSDHKIGLGFAIVGLWIMNVFTNMTQGPARALINDVVDAEYLQTANAVASAVMALAAVLGNIIGANTTNLDQPYFVLLLIGAACIAAACVPTLIAAREQPHIPKDGEPKKTVKGTFMDIYYGFRYMPKELGFIALLYFLSWAAYSPLMVNQTTYIKTVLFPDDEVYGLSIGFYSLAIFAGAQFIYSLIQPSLLRIFSVKVVYIITQIIATLSYASVLWLWPNSAAAISLITLVSLNFAAFNSIPFALVASITAGVSGGLYLGVLNSASVAAQVISINAVAVPIIAATNAANTTVPTFPAPSDSTPNLSVAWGIASGVIFSVFAVIWAFIAIRPQKSIQPDEEKPLIQNT